MIRRLVFAAATIATLAAPMAATAQAELAAELKPAPKNDYGDWWCIAVKPADVGFCQGNPLPQVPKITQLLPPLPSV